MIFNPIIPHVDVPEEVARFLDARVEHISDDIAIMNPIDDESVDTQSDAVR